MHWIQLIQKIKKSRLCSMFSLKVSQLCVVALPPLYDSYLSARQSLQTSICLNDFFSMEAGMK